MALYFKPEDMILISILAPCEICSTRVSFVADLGLSGYCSKCERSETRLISTGNLGLCRVGITEKDDIGSKLSIHPDLVDIITYDLLLRGYLSPNGSPTQKGLSVLKVDTYEVNDMVAGYVFQDPWSGELWPRFVERLDYCDREFEANGFPALLHGTTGKPRRQPAFMLLPDKKLTPSSPSTASIVEAVRLHHRIINASNEKQLQDEDYERVSTIVPKIHRVSFIEKEPTPYFIATFIYLPDSAESSLELVRCRSIWSRRQLAIEKIEQVMQELPRLHNVVNRLVKRGLHDGIEGGIEGLRRLNRC